MKADRLSPVQAMTITVAAIFGVDFLIVQNTMVSIAQQDAWISLLLGGIVTVLSAMNMYYLATLYPDKDLHQIIIHVGGKFLGRILLLFISLYILLYAGLSVRIFAQVISMFLLYTTPIYAIVALMVVTVMYPVYKGIFTIGGVIDIIFPFCKITVILLILLSFQLVDITNIQPVLFENTGNVIKGILPGFHQFTGYGVITYILCYMQSSKGTFKWYIAGIIIPIVLYVTLTIVTIMVFTAQGVMSLVHPSLTLAKSIEFPTTFLERFESFIAVLWVGVVYESIVVFSFESVRNITVLLGISEKRQNLVAYGHIPLLIIIALVIRNGLEVMKYFNMTKYLMIPAALVIIPVLTGMALIKKKKEGKG